MARQEFPTHSMMMVILKVAVDVIATADMPCPWMSMKHSSITGPKTNPVYSSKSYFALAAAL